MTTLRSRALRLFQDRRRRLRVRKLYGPPTGTQPSVSSLRATRLTREQSAEIYKFPPRGDAPMSEPLPDNEIP